jgi:hypothetical protein
MQHFHLHDLDDLKIPEPENWISGKRFRSYKQVQDVCSVDLTVAFGDNLVQSVHIRAVLPCYQLICE